MPLGWLVGATFLRFGEKGEVLAGDLYGVGMPNKDLYMPVSGNFLKIYLSICWGITGSLCCCTMCLVMMICREDTVRIMPLIGGIMTLGAAIIPMKPVEIETDPYDD